MSETITIVIVRTCRTSKGLIEVEVPGGTQDSEPMEFPTAEAIDLINLGVARLPPPHLAEPAKPPIPSSVPTE